MKDPLVKSNMSVINNLFFVMSAHYGTKFLDQFSSTDDNLEARKEWKNRLGDVKSSEIGRAFERAKLRYVKSCPTLDEFDALCARRKRSANKPQKYDDLHQEPVKRAEKGVAEAELRKLRAMFGGEQR